MSIFDSLFNVKKIVCPYDMVQAEYRKDIKVCPECKNDYPPIYKADYEKAVPFFLQLIGNSTAGKTVYMEILTVMLRSLDRFWFDGNNSGSKKNFTCIGLTDETQQFISTAKQFEQEGHLPKSTELNLLDAYILELSNMARWGSRTLVMRDVAGEAFQNMDFETKYMPFFLHVPVTIMFIPVDYLLKHNNLPQIDKLMTSFISTHIKNNKKEIIKNHTIIITLTKADKLYLNDVDEKAMLYPELVNYLENDPFSLDAKVSGIYDNNYMEKYMNNVYDHGKIVQKFFLEKFPDGKGLVAQAAQFDINLQFSIISSTGGDPLPDGEYLTAVTPKRVLDPLFIALDLQSKP